MSLDVLGEYQRAKSDYDETIRLDPDDGVACYNRAIVHTRLGMDREAQTDADRADGQGFDPSLLRSRHERGESRTLTSLITDSA